MTAQEVRLAAATASGQQMTTSSSDRREQGCSTSQDEVSQTFNGARDQENNPDLQDAGKTLVLALGPNCSSKR